MNRLFQQIKERKYSLLILCGLFVIILYAGLITVWLGDDIYYGYNIVRYCDTDNVPENLGTPIENFGDIIKSQNLHYLITNGRYEAHVLVQCFISLWGRIPFAIANALVYILFVWLIIGFTGATLKNTQAVLTVSMLVILCFSTFMGPACQINYIWMFSLCLLFLKFFFRKGEYNWWQLILLGILAFSAGESHEGLVIGIGGALIVYVLRRRLKLTVAEWIMLCCFGIGSLILCLSPGAHKRIDVISINRIMTLLLIMIFSRANFMLWGIVLYKRLTKKLSWKDVFINNQFFWIVWVISLLLVIYIGAFANRVIFGMELMAIIIGLRLLKKHSFTPLFQVLTAIITVCYLYVQLGYSINYHKQIEYLQDAYNSQNDSIIYFDTELPSAYMMFFVMSNTPIALLNDGASQKLFLKQLGDTYGTDKSVKFLPSFLKGKDKKNLSTAYYKLGNNVYLEIINKRDKGHFIVRRGGNIFGYRFHSRLREVNTRTKIFETSDWDAYLMTNEVPLTGVFDMAFVYDSVPPLVRQ